MYYKLLYVFCFILPLYAQENSVSFLKRSALEYAQKETITSLFSLLKNTPQEIQLQAAHHVIRELEQEYKAARQETDRLQGQRQKIPYELFFKLFLLEHQLEHFYQFISLEKESAAAATALKKAATDTLKQVTAKIRNVFGAADTGELDKQLAELILKFIKIERNEILSHYDQAVLYFSPRTGIKLPTLINFWQTNDIKERIKKRARYLSKPQVQWLSLVASMALQAIILAGGSMAMEWEDDADRQVFEDAQAQQSKITADWQAFQTQLSNDQKTIMGSITTSFADASKKLKAQYATSSQQLNQEILYLNRSINLDTPIIQALVSPIQYDQYFENSVMLTPASGLQWYNIYQVSQSDWEFDQEENCFRQNSLAPFPSPTLWQKSTSKQASLFTDDPQANSIFSEYATDQKTYEIEVECTIVKCSYPFFLGIIFNRGRWISGDPERIWQYRLLGFFGQETVAGKQETRKVDLCFAQQQLKQNDTKTQQIISPLEQIMSDPQTHLYQLNKDDIASFGKALPTYVFKITTSPSTVFCALSKFDDKQQPIPLYSKSISALDDYLFKFSGIGFIASGCQATFKIKKPTAVVATQSQLADFSQMIASLIK